MPVQRKRARQLKAARCSKKQRHEVDLEEPTQQLIDRLDDESEEGSWTIMQRAPAAEAHWEGYADGGNEGAEEKEEEEEECEFTEAEEDKELNESAFNQIMTPRDSTVFDKIQIKYQRGSQVSKRTSQRNAKRIQELYTAATGCIPLTSGFLISNSEKTNTAQSIQHSLEEKEIVSYQKALIDLEKKLKSKRVSVIGQNLTRHHAVLAFLKLQQSRQADETRIEMATTVARCFGRGVYFARKIVVWERTWLQDRQINVGKHGCFSKTSSWLNDEGVQLAVREWLSGSTQAGKISHI